MLLSPPLVRWPALWLGLCVCLFCVQCQPVSRETSQSQPPQTDTVATDTVRTEPRDTIRYDRYWNDAARLLAGLPVDSASTLTALATHPAAAGHRQFFDRAWKNKQLSLIQPLTVWADQELGAERLTREPAFYPFSGPDFLTIHTLFPAAGRYVFFGLEPEGSLPDLRSFAAAGLNQNLQNLQVALNDILQLTFFKTKDMKWELTRYRFRGTLPILMAFVARTGNEVLNVRHVQLQANGAVVPSPADRRQEAGDSLVTGVEILFRSEAEAPVQRLQYFSVNVRNDYIGRLKGFASMVRGLSPAHTYLKSASYLMHRASFSEIRELILEVSPTLLQDDSGIPLRYFPPDQWELTFYGVYTRPIRLFANRYQPALRQKYQQGSPEVRPLKFGIGYQYRTGTSNLMLARRK